MEHHKLTMRFLLILALGLPLAAQTKLFLRSSTATSGLGLSIGNTSIGYGCAPVAGYNHLIRPMITTAGAGAAAQILTPTSTAPPCQWGDGPGTAYVTWFSPPLSSGLTLSGNIDFNCSCAESNNALNSGCRFIVKRWDASDGGIKETVMTSADTTECAGARIAIAAAAPTSTVFNTGDRVALIVEVRNVGGGWGGNGSRTTTLSYNAGSGSFGDTFVNFADTLSFAADTNNWPAKGMSAQLNPVVETPTSFFVQWRDRKWLRHF